MNGTVCVRTWIKPLQKFHCAWNCVESCLLEAFTLRARVVHSNASRQVPHARVVHLDASRPVPHTRVVHLNVFRQEPHTRVVHSNTSRQVKYTMDAIFHVNRPRYATECVPKMKGRLFFLAGYLITHHDVVLAFWHIRRSQTQIFIRNILTTDETNPRIKEPVAKPGPPGLGFQNPCGKRK